jgi:hypothetical protein
MDADQSAPRQSVLNRSRQTSPKRSQQALMSIAIRESDGQVLSDHTIANWEIDCKLTLDEIETGLNKLDAGFDSEKIVRVFQGMQRSESNNELAAAIGKSLQTVTRIKRIIRAFAMELLEIEQDKYFNDDKGE